jgi:8-oxo-dGTP diphosphatase
VTASVPEAGGGEGELDAGAWDVPRVAVSVNALIWDRAGRVLVVKPTYKSGWSLPGGQMEADGETPWEACRREVREECGLEVTAGRMRAVDFRRPRTGHGGGMRVVFDCGVLDEAAAAGIVVQEGEIAECRFVSPDTADDLLRPAVRRRLRAVLSTDAVVYLEEGVPVEDRS